MAFVKQKLFFRKPKDISVRYFICGAKASAKGITNFIILKFSVRHMASFRKSYPESKITKAMIKFLENKNSIQEKLLAGYLLCWIGFSIYSFPWQACLISFATVIFTFLSYAIIVYVGRWLVAKQNKLAPLVLGIGGLFVLTALLYFERFLFLIALAFFYGMMVLASRYKTTTASQPTKITIFLQDCENIGRHWVTDTPVFYHFRNGNLLLLIILSGVTAVFGRNFELFFASDFLFTGIPGEFQFQMPLWLRNLILSTELLWLFWLANFFLFAAIQLIIIDYANPLTNLTGPQRLLVILGTTGGGLTTYGVAQFTSTTPGIQPIFPMPVVKYFQMQRLGWYTPSGSEIALGVSFETLSGQKVSTLADGRLDPIETRIRLKEIMRSEVYDALNPFSWNPRIKK